MERDLPKLIILTGPEQGQEFSLKGKDIVFVGRSDENELILADTSVSRRHITLLSKAGKWHVKDESSRNGCVLNDQKLTPDVETPLNNADVIKLGLYELRFLESNVSAEEIHDKTSYKKNALPPVTEDERKNEQEVMGEVVQPPVTETPVGDSGSAPNVSENENVENEPSQLSQVKIDAEPGDLSSDSYSAPRMGRGLLIFGIIALVFCGFGVAAFLYNQQQQENDEQQVSDLDEDDTNEDDASADDDDVDDKSTIKESAVPDQTVPANNSTTPTQDVSQSSKTSVSQTVSKETADHMLGNSSTLVQPDGTSTTTQDPQDAVAVQSDSTRVDDAAGFAALSVTPSATIPETTTSDPIVLPSTTGTVNFQAMTAVVSDSTVANEPLHRDFSVFLEVVTEPMPAVIYLEDQDLGRTPFRRSVSIVPGQEYTLNADFELHELNDIYRKKVRFKSKPDSDVIELNVDAEIGILKIQKLPRKVDFYLEGYYDHDKVRSQPVKISDIVYGKPIYLPYGKYVVELREKTKIAGSDNLVNVIRYQREYHITKDNRILTLSVTDKDLQLFPAVIKSNPSNATVYFGDEKVGVTPFTGNLALGKKRLKIVKDGYFPHVVDVDITMNSVYELTIDLKTSKMGELINEAKEKLRNSIHDDAIQILVDALKYGGSAREKNEVYYLLGDAYLAKKDYDQAMPYFEKAKASEEFFLRATIGLSRVYHAQKQSAQALKTIVEALVNLNENTPPAVRGEANSAFRIISPVKSVMYIYTEPAGAAVFVNDKRIDQATPLILSDLGLGNYRLQFEKSGFQTYKTKQNLKVGEFVLVKVKLRPESL